MKKTIISIAIISAFIAQADGQFAIIVDKKNNNYTVDNYKETGNVLCNDISPLVEDIYKDKDFVQTHSQCKKETVNNSGTIVWKDIDDYTTNEKGNLLLNNCTQILNGGHSEGDGTYTVLNNSSEIDVTCDMTTNGGGWTLVAYAGEINGSKASTTGNSDGKWLPLFFNFGEYQKDAISTKKSFSRFDLFKDESNVGDEFLAKRTSVPNKMMIFPITYKSWWGNSNSTPHFAITTSNRTVPYLKLTNSGNNGWKTVTNDTDWFVFDGGYGSSTYPGLDWNRPEGDNSHDSGTFDTSLGHRVLLYWESADSVGQYTDNQWFHGQPMSMGNVEALPDNDVQDMEFWYREK